MYTSTYLYKHMPYTHLNMHVNMPCYIHMKINDIEKKSQCVS